MSPDSSSWGDSSVVHLQTQFFPQLEPILKKTRHTPEASIPAPSLAAPGPGQPQRRPSCSRSLPSHCFLAPTPPLVPGVLPHFPPRLLITARRRVLMGNLIQITDAFGLLVALATPAPWTPHPDSAAARNRLRCPKSSWPDTSVWFSPIASICHRAFPIKHPETLSDVRLEERVGFSHPSGASLQLPLSPQWAYGYSWDPDPWSILKVFKAKLRSQ